MCTVNAIVECKSTGFVSVNMGFVFLNCLHTLTHRCLFRTPLWFIFSPPAACVSRSTTDIFNNISKLLIPFFSSLQHVNPYSSLQFGALQFPPNQPALQTRRMRPLGKDLIKVNQPRKLLPSDKFQNKYCKSASDEDHKMWHAVPCLYPCECTEPNGRPGSFSWTVLHFF